MQLGVSWEHYSGWHWHFVQQVTSVKKLNSEHHWLGDVNITSVVASKPEMFYLSLETIWSLRYSSSEMSMGLENGKWNLVILWMNRALGGRNSSPWKSGMNHSSFYKRHAGCSEQWSKGQAVVFARAGFQPIAFYLRLQILFEYWIDSFTAQRKANKLAPNDGPLKWADFCTYIMNGSFQDQVRSLLKNLGVLIGLWEHEMAKT